MRYVLELLTYFLQRSLQGIFEIDHAVDHEGEHRIPLLRIKDVTGNLCFYSACTFFLQRFPDQCTPEVLLNLFLLF